MNVASVEVKVFLMGNAIAHTMSKIVLENAEVDPVLMNAVSAEVEESNGTMENVTVLVKSSVAMVSVVLEFVRITVVSVVDKVLYSHTAIVTITQWIVPEFAVEKL